MRIATCDVVIPLYRERAALPALVAALASLDADAALPSSMYLFVDDGSGDGTAELAEALLADSQLESKARVLRHERNRGLAAGLRTAFHAGRGDVSLWFDADLSYHTDVLPRLVALVVGGADVATVSPWHPKGRVEGVPRTRVALSRGLSRACRLLAAKNRGGQEAAARDGAKPTIHTWSAMVRAWRRTTLARCLPEREGHLGVTESLLRARALGARIEELPATLRGRVEGRSGLKVLPCIAGQLGLLGAAATGRLARDSRAFDGD